MTDPRQAPDPAIDPKVEALPPEDLTIDQLDQAAGGAEGGGGGKVQYQDFHFTKRSD